ncbi:MAG: glycogen/starch synthase, partial [Candidatus Aenigmarchaeota archaeon]|nr:glycogen/starch synthase [Candidatus Aenigmarchaeota archaeon]
IEKDSVKYIFLDNVYFADSIYMGDLFKQEIFLGKGTLEALIKLGIKPDIIHLNDGHTGFVGYLLRNYERYSRYPLFSKTKLITTIHNAGMAYQQIFPTHRLNEVSIINVKRKKIVWNGNVNLLYAAIINSDRVNTVSKDYEITLKTSGEGMREVFVRKNVIGIVNGIDIDYWRFPELRGRKNIKQTLFKYKPKWKGKLIETLEEKTGKELQHDKMIVIMPRRLADQKGFDKILPIIKPSMESGIQFAVLGVAHPNDPIGHQWANEFRKLHEKFSEFVFIYSFDEELAKLMYWGGDLILYPSVPNKEPCGTGYMMAGVNGTPVVGTKTGGLVEKIVEFDPIKKSGNGFLVWKEEYSTEAFYRKMMEAREIFYSDEESWKILSLNIAKTDFDIKNVAKEYILKMYNPLFRK